MLDEPKRAYLENTIGGTKGHLLRRAFHISMIIFPFLYYWYGHQIAESTSNVINFLDTRENFVFMILIMIILLESIRLLLGIAIFGQREYEKKQVSALAWGAFSLCLCLLLAPLGGYNGSYIGMPIILTLALIDPLLGETRRHLDSNNLIILIALFACVIIWLSCSFFLGTPYFLSILMPPLCVAAEWPSLKYIDDNATMVFAPLFVSLLII
ncbi:MAG: hypothetical protein CMB64_02585 [Euryarchaeota archaeon]|nr:hypothetical protein [Euryarchaeota archaeon]